MIRMMVLSNIVNWFLCLDANPPQNLWSIKPTITGNMIFMINSRKVLPSSNEDSLFVSRTKLIQIGVSKIPRRPEMLALKIAPGIFPLAIETITTEEDTVEGRAARKNTPSHKV